MNILVVGSGKGSWEIRGLQLGGAIGARVMTSPHQDDFAWADVVILIKRAGMQWAGAAQRAGKPIVWDAVDCWGQPHANSYGPSHALALVQAQITVIEPALTIGATEAMAEAIGGVYLPHHSREGLRLTPAREVVSCVGYDGNAAYLGRWRPAIEAECQRRGWTFVVNPADLSACDILVAFRDGPWDGWICREWKSGVKLVNAMAVGRPIITQVSAAFRELKPAGTVIANTSELAGAFDEWESIRWRGLAWSKSLAAPGYTLARVAEMYRRILSERFAACPA